MKDWKHFNFEQRKMTVHLLAKRSKLCVIKAQDCPALIIVIEPNLHEKDTTQIDRICKK